MICVGGIFMKMKGKNTFFYITFGTLAVLIVLLLLVFCINIFRDKDVTPRQKEYTCTFIRTYKIEYILPSNSEDFLYLTIRAFQDEEVQTVKISKSLLPKIEQGKYYEFKFRPLKKIEQDTILNIYQKSKIISIEETQKIGLEQIQDKICES